MIVSMKVADQKCLMQISECSYSNNTPHDIFQTANSRKLTSRNFIAFFDSRKLISKKQSARRIIVINEILCLVSGQNSIICWKGVAL